MYFSDAVEEKSTDYQSGATGLNSGESSYRHAPDGAGDERSTKRGQNQLLFLADATRP
jgi:hypothetical protein